MQSHQIFESLPPSRLFFRCAVPSMISMAVTSLYVVIDGIFVGRFLGGDALAAVSLVMPFIMISFALSDMVAVGSSVQISICLGQKDEKKASRIFSFCSGLILLISMVVGTAAFFLAEPLVRMMGANETVTALSARYMQVFAAFSPLVMIFFAVDNYLRICGRARYSMWINVILSLVNILLDYLFIARFGWGIGSAALASCISLALGTLLGYLPFLRGKLTLRLVWARLPLRQVLSLLANGSSEFFSNISGSILMVILNAVLLGLTGPLGVAAFSIVMYIDSIVGSLLFGLADSMQPAISYNYGAGHFDRLRALEGRTLLAGALVSLAALLLMLVGGDQIIRLFIEGDDPALYEMSLRAMRLFSFSYLVGWFGVITSSFFTALNRPLFSFLTAFGKTLIFPLFSLFTLPARLGLDGVWLTSLLSGLLTAVMASFFLILLKRASGRRVS